MVTQSIVLRSRQHYGQRVPMEAFGHAQEMLPGAIRQSVRMALEGRSVAKGPRPDWLKAASDIRFVGISGDDETVLHCELPSLGDAAPRLFDGPESGPDRADTGLDLLADVWGDVAGGNADSAKFDRALLNSLAHFKKFVGGTFSVLEVGRQGQRSPTLVTAAVVAAARSLSANVPRPQRVRLVGRLDMIRASTQAFALLLDDGSEVRGVLSDGEVSSLASLVGHRVLCLGQAVYRPSGKLLRVESDSVAATTDSNAFFSVAPKSARRRPNLRELFDEQKSKSGIRAIIGQWPGDETDEEILAALRDMD